MESKSLSKLQIRSEVLSILQQTEDLADARSNYESIYNRLKSIEDQQSVLEILINELTNPTLDQEKFNVLSFIIIEIAELSQVNDYLWGIIKSNTNTDKAKEAASNILRALGEKINPELLIEYFNNPDEIIDQETKRLLETAVVNPEAQIDFLDFMFALGTDEQIQLINSLNQDYSGNELANIIVPAVYYTENDEIKALLLDILGQTKSYFALKPIKDTIQYSKNDKLLKIAQRSLKLLRLAGVNPDKEMPPENIQLLKNSSLYRFYASLIDGIGNQGLILSRKNPSNKITMFSAVINDRDGVIDSFGFSAITDEEFNKIIERFKATSTVVEVSAEYCKLKLEQAEHINLTNNTRIPYEYSAWKTVIQDIKPLQEDVVSILPEWVNDELVNEYKKLYQLPDFNNWFLDEEDHDFMKEFLPSIISDLSNNKALLDNSEYIENKINLGVEKVFDSEYVKLLKNRLISVSVLLDYNNDAEYRNICASLGHNLDPQNLENTSCKEFLKDIIRKSVFQCLLRMREKSMAQNKSLNIFSLRKKAEKQETEKSLSLSEIDEIIEALRKFWI